MAKVNRLQPGVTLYLAPLPEGDRTRPVDAQFVMVDGGNTSGLKGEKKTVESTDFNSGNWMDKQAVRLGWSVPWQGTFPIGDKGIALAESLHFSFGECYVRFIRSDGKVRSGAAIITGYAEDGQIDNLLKLSFNVEGTDELLFEPVIKTMTPAEGAVGLAVAFTGFGFNTLTAVRYGAANAANPETLPEAVFTVEDDMEMTATVPAGAADGVFYFFGGGVVVKSPAFNVTP